MAESTGEESHGSFEAALEQLAELVATLESGGLGLSESISAYERGVQILRRLHEELAVAEERVKVLVRIDDAGRPVLADFAAPEERSPAAGDAVTAESPQTARSRPAGGTRGRSSRPRRLPGMDDADAPVDGGNH